MPESPRMVPLYVARVMDLRIGNSVAVRCRACGHVAELSVVMLREKLPRNGFVKHLGPQFRCQSLLADQQVAEPAQRRAVRNVLLQAQTDKLAERQPVRQ